jgi:uncharacterized Zn finger protein (UPF0148 family)
MRSELPEAHCSECKVPLEYPQTMCARCERKFPTEQTVDPNQRDRFLAASRPSVPSGFYMISELDGLDPDG